MPSAWHLPTMPPATESNHAADYAERHQRFRRIVLIAAIVVILIAGALIWRHHEASTAAAAAAHRAATAGISITTVTANAGDINVYLNAIGTVTPVYTNSITSQVNGLVVAVNYQGRPAGSRRAIR